MASSSATSIRLSPAGIRRGFLRTLPVAIGVTVFGLVLGVLAAQKGLSAPEVMLMSALVFAGASQLAAIEAWTDPPALVALAATAFLVNLRYAIMTPVLAPWLAGQTPFARWTSLHLTADENWAISVAEMRAGGRDAGFLIGSGLALWSFWVAATGLGHVLGQGIVLSADHPLTFIGTAVFLALLGGLWRSAADLLPWTVAGLTALAAESLLPGSWYLLVGGLAGSLVGAVRDRMGERAGHGSA